MMAESSTRPTAEVTMSPAEQVLAQLGRQKRAVDARDVGALRPLYTADSEHVLYPGATLHLIGSHVIEPLGGGRMRCRSYAAYLALDQAGTPCVRSYGAYDDIWVADAGEWRLAYRETVMYGYGP
jgi:hypothetical protein